MSTRIESPIELYTFLRSNEFHSLTENHEKYELDRLINELYPEGFLIKRIKILEKVDKYHTFKYGSRKYKVHMSTENGEKFTALVHFSKLIPVRFDTYYDVIVSMNSDIDTDFILDDVLNCMDWKYAEDNLHCVVM